MAGKIIKTFISAEQKALKVFTIVAGSEQKKLFSSVQIVLCGCLFVTVDNWSLSQWTFLTVLETKGILVLCVESVSIFVAFDPGCLHKNDGSSSGKHIDPFSAFIDAICQYVLGSKRQKVKNVIYYSF